MLDETTLNEIQKLIGNIQDSDTLIQLKALLDVKLEDVKQAEIEQFVAKAQELQRNYGIEPTDLATALSSNRGKGLRVKDKYRSKTNPNNGWSGRGKQPAWIKEYLDSNPNHKLEDLLVDKSAVNTEAKPEQKAEAPKAEANKQQAQQAPVKK